MIPGTDDLSRAREVLVRIGTPACERLVAAWPAFWRAMYYEPQWPATLRHRADALVQRVLIAGEVGATVRALNSADAQTLVNDIRRFIDDCHRHGVAHAEIEVVAKEPEGSPTHPRA